MVAPFEQLGRKPGLQIWNGNLRTAAWTRRNGWINRAQERERQGWRLTLCLCLPAPSQDGPHLEHLSRGHVRPKNEEKLFIFFSVNIWIHGT